MSSNNDNEDIQRRLLAKLEEVSQGMQKFNIAEYIQLLNDPKRFFWINFLGGVFRGIGIAVGMTIFGAMIIYFMQRLVMLNLPLIGDFIAELIRIVQQHL